MGQMYVKHFWYGEWINVFKSFGNVVITNEFLLLRFLPLHCKTYHPHKTQLFIVQPALPQEYNVNEILEMISFQITTHDINMRKYKKIDWLKNKNN